VMNDIAAIAELCDARGISLCLDCISSLGVMPVDLSRVWLATGVSGKGLAAYPGLSIVFHHHAINPAPKQLPRYLDLGLYGSVGERSSEKSSERGGERVSKRNCKSESENPTGDTPFTHSSNLVEALHAALLGVDWVQKFAQISRDGATLRRSLGEAGFNVVAESAFAAPAVVTIALPADINAFDVGEAMDVAGFLLSYRSAYLQERNWLQICLMGAYESEALDVLVAQLRHVAMPPNAKREAAAR
jgi:aspartate aminotransferase-like enzyme